MPWTIYCHIHIESGRRYIGLTSRSWQSRWKNHCYAAKSSKGGRWHFPNAIRKYGKEAFSHEVLEICHSLEVANLAEECWISFYETRDPEKGFNLVKGGQHVPHPIRKNPWDDPEYRAKIHTINMDACFSCDAREAQRKSLTSETRSNATKKLWSNPLFRDKVLSANMDRSASVYERSAATYKERGHKPSSKAIANSITNRRERSILKTHSNCRVHGLVPASECFQRIRRGLIQLECAKCRTHRRTRPSKSQ